MLCFVLKKSSISTVFGILIASLVLMIPTVSIAVNSANYNPITRIITEENKVALSINVYENTDIDTVLIALGDTKATFFISEEFEFRYGDKVKEMLSYGHTIGILEDNLYGKSAREIRDRLSERIEKQSYLTGINCRLVRFVKNSFDDNCIKTVLSLGLIPVQWSTDDTTESLERGDIILITGESEVKDFIKKITDGGYEIATVDGLLTHLINI